MPDQATEAVRVRGCCHVYYGRDIGFSVDLKHCASLIQEAREDGGFRAHARTPSYLGPHPTPVRLSQAIEPIQGSSFRTEDRVTLTIYDFGAVSVQYRIPFEDTLTRIAALSSELYDNKQFAADARSRAESLLAAIGPAVRRPKIREETEDYLVFAVPEVGGEKGLGIRDSGLEGNKLPQMSDKETLIPNPQSPIPSPSGLDHFLAANGQALAQILSSNTAPLSVEQERQELSSRIAYYADDLTIITWNAAMVFGKGMEDVLTLLELANVQLRELHYLDDQLDDSLQESYEFTARVADLKAEMRRIRELMLDGQAFSEAVTNAFKPFPDAFLARLYGLASESLGLNHFDQSIKDKLNLLNTLYTTVSDEAAHARSVRLEWIVIVLIAIEIVLAIWDKLWPLVLPK